MKLPERTAALMNLSERPEFDAMFPEHPLSIARAFVNCVLGAGSSASVALFQMSTSMPFTMPRILQL